MNKWAPLHQIFYDTKTGYTGLKALTISAKEENLSLTPSEIKQWYDAQQINQIFNFGKNKSYILFSNKYPARIMADLIDRKSVV